jgi:Protein of unknown function (DUF2505)
MMPCMDLQTELRYDADPDDVFTMLCDEDFRTEVCEATHATAYDVSIAPGSESVTVRISRAMPAPDVARTFVGDTLEIVQVERWGGRAADGSRVADLSIDIPGKPGSMLGSVVLTPTGSGTVEAITGEITVRIPLVGGKLEREIAQGILAAVKAEGRVGRGWLNRSSG